ncbi:MAG: hypothetical protein J5963_04835, partial [Schwartzia sp.]|nr:hypothetical protein [Schwartzia sp. (in: firmicutes)]
MDMKLNAGDRLELREDDKFIKVLSGHLEAYAVTAGGGSSYRQFFLTEIGAGEAAFPALDEFGEIAVMLYADEDTELSELSFAGESPETLKPLMKTWFRHLGEIPQLRLLADKGDDILRSWRDGSVLEAAEERDALTADFTESEQIFAMLLGMQFGAEDKRLARRVKARAFG